MSHDYVHTCHPQWKAHNGLQWTQLCPIMSFISSHFTLHMQDWQGMLDRCSNHHLNWWWVTGVHPTVVCVPHVGISPPSVQSVDRERSDGRSGISMRILLTIRVRNPHKCTWQGRGFAEISLSVLQANRYKLDVIANCLALVFESDACRTPPASASRDDSKTIPCVLND